MRDIYELIDRLAETTQAVLDCPAGAKMWQYRQLARAAGEAWEEYLEVMAALEPEERPLADPLWPDRMAAAAELTAERQAFYAQQTENIRAAWAAREGA